MKKDKFLLDTCVLIWLLEGDNRVFDFFSKNTYPEFVVSIDSLKEIFYKRSKGILKLRFDYNELVDVLLLNDIKIEVFDKKHLKNLYDLPFYEKHKDPNDRAIITLAITQHYTLVSGDRLFNNCLEYIIV